MRRTLQTAFVLIGAFAAATAVHAQSVPSLAIDTPTTVGAVEAVCTGIGLEARQDARWTAYPLRIELAGAGGVFLGDAQVSAEKKGEPAVSLHCDGPWVLLKVAPGTYRVTAEVEGKTVSANATVPAKGQSHIVLRFPVGGAVSREHTAPAID